MIRISTLKVIFSIAILILFFVGLFFLSKSKSFQFFGEIYPNISTTHKIIALTFDDGPSPKTDTVLSILQQNKIKATFFLTGNSMHHYFNETERIVNEGHEIGNHTFSHDRLILKSHSTIAKEIEMTDSLIRKAGYQKEIHFRPTHAMKLLVLPYYLKKNNRKTITWDIEPESENEVASNSNMIAEYVIKNSKNGSIILLHPMYDWDGESINSINKIINGLTNRGFEFKTVSELLEYESK